MSKLIDINEFLYLSGSVPFADVRSPSEFEKGHIPGAISLPLFDDNERKVIGTLYNKSGQKESILSGLEIAGKKLRELAAAGIKASVNKNLILYCWRGGMRSASLAWLYETCSINSYVLEGGYKTFRRYIADYFNLPFKFIVIGGMTGSGKTSILKELANRSFQVLNFESIARHKGSVFGHLGEEIQPTNEQFENILFSHLRNFDLQQPVFVEDESRNIGKNIIPPGVFNKMTEGQLVILDQDRKIREEALFEEYGRYSEDELISCIQKISKRLGSEHSDKAMGLIREGNKKDALKLILSYYDKKYTYGLKNKRNPKISEIRIDSRDVLKNTEFVLRHLKNAL
jgi:tRNA 2-selenouridine synthase